MALMVPALNLPALYAACAPSVAASTLDAIVRTESGGSAWIIGVNGNPHRVARPSSAPAAFALAGDLIAAGVSVDLGLMQINSSNLGILGLSVAEAFDPCRNLAAGAKLLQAAYDAELQRSDRRRSAALDAALSRYNTGSRWAGFANGYIERIHAAADGRMRAGVRLVQAGRGTALSRAELEALAKDAGTDVPTFAATAALGAASTKLVDRAWPR
jgi:type IV secretion system protein VirB1